MTRFKCTLAIKRARTLSRINRIAMNLNQRLKILQVALVLAIAPATLISAPLLTQAQQAQQSQQLTPSQPTAETVVTDLKDPSDFAVSRDGKTIFVAEIAEKHIRRFRGDMNDVVLTGIEHDEETASTISVFAIDDNHILIGAAGFSDPKFALTLFDLSAVENLPLDFIDNVVEPSRNFDRIRKKADAFDVLGMFEQQRGVSVVRRLAGQRPSLCNLHLKGGQLDRLEHREQSSEVANLSNLSTLAVDPLGGYFATVLSDSDSTSTLIFSQAEGKIIQTFPLDLTHVASLGFASKNQHLYALVVADDSESSDDSIQTGIYEILSKDDNCFTKLVLAVERPQKMKMDAEGNAWVMCQTDAEKSHLIKVTGLGSPSVKAD